MKYLIFKIIGILQTLLLLFLYCGRVTSAQGDSEEKSNDRIRHLQEQLLLLKNTNKDLLAQINNSKNSTGVFMIYLFAKNEINLPCNGINWNNYECIQFLKRTILKLQDQVNTQTDQLKGLQHTIVPVGFIYTQLPGQPEPYRLWDTMSWIDIAAEYAGLFFRVLGGNSERFNVTQIENSPRLFHVNTLTKTAHNYNIDVRANGQLSEGVTTDAHGSAGTWRLQFQVSGGEVRPRNQAVRIWKRSH